MISQVKPFYVPASCSKMAPSKGKLMLLEMQAFWF